MHLANINFQRKVGKFGLSSGGKGSNEKKLIQDSLDIDIQRLENRINSGRSDDQDKKDFERFKNTKKVVNSISVLVDDSDFELLDDESNRVSYDDICDIIDGLHEHIGVLERDDSYLTTNKEKYWELRRILSELNDEKMRFMRTVKYPQGFFRKK